MTESERRLREFCADGEGAYPVLKKGARARLDRAIRGVLTREPKPETAFAELFALHRLFLETQQLTDVEQFVGMFEEERE